MADNMTVTPQPPPPPTGAMCNAVVKVAPDGTVKVLTRAGGTVDFILDVNGYFE